MSTANRRGVPARPLAGGLGHAPQHQQQEPPPLSGAALRQHLLSQPLPDPEGAREDESFHPDAMRPDIASKIPLDAPPVIYDATNRRAILIVPFPDGAEMKRSNAGGITYASYSRQPKAWIELADGTPALVGATAAVFDVGAARRARKNKKQRD